MACPHCSAPTSPGARFCPQCGHALDQPGRGLEVGDRRVVTALFADLVGYTRLVDELDAEEVRERVDAAFELLAAAVLRFGGSLEKFVGDAVLVVFGVPTAHDDDATRACLCGLEMRAALARGADERPLRLRIGVATGEVVAAVRSVGGTRSVALIGGPMTTAARLQQLAEPDEILVDGATVAAAEPRVESQRVAERLLRGQTRPVAVHRLLAERRIVRRSRRGQIPLVGREAEVSRLAELLCGAAARGIGGAVLVRGEAGVGKSRLLAEMEPVAADAGFRWTWIDNVSHGSGEPYRAVRGMIDWLAEEYATNPGVLSRRFLFGPDLDDELGRRLTGAIALVAEDSDMELRPEDGWDVSGAPAPRSPAEIVELLRLAARRLLRSLVADGPRCVVLDDYHWADPSSRPLIDEMVRSTAELPLVVLAGTRPTDLPGWTELPNVEVIELGGLDLAATEVLGTTIAGGTLEPEAVRWLHDRTAGNALFIGEIVRALRDGNGLDPVDGRLRLARGARRTAVPLSLRALLGARIDALPPALRSALDVASVIGMSFPEWLFRELDESASVIALHGLAEAGILEPDGEAGSGSGVWQFRHPLFHDVAYARLLAERRRRLHAALADRLALVEPPVPAAELARHRAAAGDVQAALPLLERAASEAALRGAAAEAAWFWQAAVDLLGQSGAATELRARAAAALAVSEAMSAASAADRPTGGAAYVTAAPGHAVARNPGDEGCGPAASGLVEALRER